MGPYSALRVLIGPYGPLKPRCVLMDSNSFLCVHIGPYSFLWTPLNLNGSLYVLLRPMRAYGS